MSKKTRAVCYCSSVMYDQILDRSSRECRSLAQQMIFLVKRGLELGQPLRQRDNRELLGAVLDGERQNIWFYPSGAMMTQIAEYKDRWDLVSNSAAIRVLVYTAIYNDMVETTKKGGLL